MIFDFNCFFIKWAIKWIIVACLSSCSALLRSLRNKLYAASFVPAAKTKTSCYRNIYVDAVTLMCSFSKAGKVTAFFVLENKTAFIINAA